MREQQSDWTCAGCLSSRTCWVCDGTGAADPQSRLGTCRSCSGTRTCRYCSEVPAGEPASLAG